MNKKYFLLIILATAVLTVGCSKNPDEKIEVVSPTCADLGKVIDPVQKAELLKKCPRGGPAFKPSDKKEW